MQDAVRRADSLGWIGAGTDGEAVLKARELHANARP